MEEYRYTKEHLWARLDDDDRVTIGISDFAIQEWGEIVSVSLPEEGDELIQDEIFGNLEASSEVDLYSPLSGEVIEINDELRENPEIINEDPLQDGWLLRMVIPSLSDFDELLTEAEYEDYLKEELGEEVEDVEDVEDLEEGEDEDSDDEYDDEDDDIDDLKFDDD